MENLQCLLGMSIKKANTIQNSRVFSLRVIGIRSTVTFDSEKGDREE